MSVLCTLNFIDGIDSKSLKTILNDFDLVCNWIRFSLKLIQFWCVCIRNRLQIHAPCVQHFDIAILRRTKMNRWQFSTLQIERNIFPRINQSINSSKYFDAHIFIVYMAEGVQKYLHLNVNSSVLVERLTSIIPADGISKQLADISFMTQKCYRPVDFSCIDQINRNRIPDIGRF